MKDKKEICRNFLKKIAENSPYLLLFSGFILFAFSEKIGKLFDSLFFELPIIGGVHLESSIHSLGTTIIVSGVYAFLIQSALFSKYYRKLFFDVIYSPNNKISEESIQDKWKILTDAIIQKKVPFEGYKVADKLMSDYLKQETDYGFRNVEVIFTIDKMKDSSIVKIKQIFKADVVFPADTRPFHIKQRVSCKEGQFSYLSLFINNSIVDHENYVVKRNTSGEEVTYSFSFPVAMPRDHCHEGSQSASLRFERTTMSELNLAHDPVLVGSYSRYIQGLSILIKATGIDHILFRTGVGPTSSPKINRDGSGYWHHILADSNTLLLPGEGYTLAFVPLERKEGDRDETAN